MASVLSPHIHALSLHEPSGDLYAKGRIALRRRYAKPVQACTLLEKNAFCRDGRPFESVY